MKKYLLLLLFLCAPLFGQGGNTLTITFPGVPSGTCAGIMLGVNAATGDLYDCLSGAWHLAGGGAGGVASVIGSATVNVNGSSSATCTTACTPTIPASVTLTTPNIGAATGTSLTVTGALTSGSGSGVAGALDCLQGTLPGILTNTFSIVCPTGVTGYELVIPAAAATGIPHWSNAANVVTQSVSTIVNADIANSTIDLTAKVTGALPLANGGTGQTSLASAGIVVGAGNLTTAGRVPIISAAGTLTEDANFFFNTTASTQYIRAGAASGGALMGYGAGNTSFPGIWMGTNTAAPDFSNYALLQLSATEAAVGGSGAVSMKVGNVAEVRATATDVTFGTGLDIIRTGRNGSVRTCSSNMELLTIAASPTSATTMTLPAGALVESVAVRVTVAIPTATTFTVTGTTSSTVFNTAAVSVAANSTDVGTAAGAYYNATSQTITITPNGTPAANTGRVRVQTYYCTTTAPVS